jgi:hypothetical protein
MIVEDAEELKRMEAQAALDYSKAAGGMNLQQ